MTSQQDKAQRFRSLHTRDRAFIIPNPWDIGSAHILAHLGFEALATTSAGLAFSHGMQDNMIGRDAVLDHIRSLSAATNLPVSADLENGFGDAPEAAAETIRLAAEAGAVGGSIEDATGRDDGPIYCLEHAVARVQAAVEAARSVPHGFTLTARAENYLHGRPDLKDTITRLQAYQEAGADVLYAPGITSKQDIETLMRSVNRPVNVLAGLPGFTLTQEELSQLGVKRISTGGCLYRVAMDAFIRAAREMREQGTFGFVDGAISGREIAGMIK